MATSLFPIDALVIWWITLQIGCSCAGLFILLTLTGKSDASVGVEVPRVRDPVRDRKNRGRYARARGRRAARNGYRKRTDAPRLPGTHSHTGNAGLGTA